MIDTRAGGQTTIARVVVVEDATRRTGTPWGIHFYVSHYVNMT